MQNFTPITFLNSACNCPSCNTFATQEWYKLFCLKYSDSTNTGLAKNMYLSQCSYCNEYSIWKGTTMIFPSYGNTPIPNSDLPSDIMEDFNEARQIVEFSPRGAVALLRLAVQKLCKHLGEEGENINTDIKNLVAKGLPPKMQKALDSVRVIGNNAVHPGLINIKDDKEIAYKLFGFINIICDVLVTQPKEIDDFYELKIPNNAKHAIQKRDKKP